MTEEEQEKAIKTVRTKHLQLPGKASMKPKPLDFSASNTWTQVRGTAMAQNTTT